MRNHWIGRPVAAVTAILAPVIVALGAVSGVASGAAAQPADLSETEAQILPRVIDSLCLDMIDERLGCEQAMLLASETQPDRADLVILTDWRDDPPSVPLLVARNVAFNGSMWGMAPRLEAAENGSLRLQSEQSGIGRFPWVQTFTIAYRDERFVLAGFSYSTYDRAAGGGMTCDINLLTGDYTVEAHSLNLETEERIQTLSETGQTDPLDLDVANLGTNAPFPAPCEMGMAAIDSY